MIRFLAATAFIALGLTLPAQAQNNRSFISGTGSDSASCTRPAPCRSFAQAITQTNAGGEIIVLDSAGYGAFTIDKSITITNPGGVEAAITPASGGTAVTINATTSIAVTLRGITLSGGGVGGTGINVTSTMPVDTRSSLTLIGCTIQGFKDFGIFLQPTGQSGGGKPGFYVTLLDSFVIDNSGNGIHAIPPISLDTYLLIYHTVLQRNENGLVATNGHIVFSSSHMDVNKFSGMVLSSFAVTYLKHSTVTFNGSSDISNAASLNLHDENEIGYINNTGQAFTDSTNAVTSVNGNALVALARR